eukprot:CAMPEP_0198336578 /NCGR_PEP_ID=MMETSP1450-20131203/21067_1 /TAXON_ID=753684 ORGANISM="Madagascaria erythrocladiodes, Strain CCMP3234" /NCGR_SAMPLE_ID=MMETSP1450 /ASSEMBLY_ACC=CAM_ASM_001115 /LENGTH=488 /DNA_ID=CAMNT_0044041327 /DNA_START=116 /DNA_END=1582 /DNA_ORIENTATION=+
MVRCSALLVLGALTHVASATPWFVTTDTSASYLSTSRFTGEETPNSKCAKVPNRGDPNGQSVRFRPINTDDSQQYWQTVRGPRNSYATRPEDVDPDLWRFLGGDTQMFFSMTNRVGLEVSYAAALRCVVWTNNSVVAQSEVGDVEYGTGYVLATGEEPTLLALDQPMPGVHGLPVTPVVQGMTPGLRFPIDVETPWEEDEEKFAAKTADNLMAWVRYLFPSVRKIDGSGFSQEAFFNVLPTRSYSEKQCRAWLDANDKITEQESDLDEQIGITGVLTGDKVCQRDSVKNLFQNIATEVAFSPNVPLSPLTPAQGLFLVTVPAIWEAILASLLLVSRVLRRKRGPVKLGGKARWLAFEIITLAVSVAEFGQLISSTVEQFNWQPCQLGRWSGGDILIETGDELAWFGNEEGVLGIYTDLVVLECFKAAGTDLKWAIVVGSVVVFHVLVLMFELLYFSSARVRSVMEKSLSFRRSRRSDSASKSSEAAPL